MGIERDRTKKNSDVISAATRLSDGPKSVRDIFIFRKLLFIDFFNSVLCVMKSFCWYEVGQSYIALVILLFSF